MPKGEARTLGDNRKVQLSRACKAKNHGECFKRNCPCKCGHGVDSRIVQNNR